MPVDEVCRKQVALLVMMVPYVAPETSFALKGGTAINLFLRDMPRLSVDIDLTYLPIADRASSLKGIDTALRRMAKEIRSATRSHPSCIKVGQIWPFRRNSYGMPISRPQ